MVSANLPATFINIHKHLLGGNIPTAVAIMQLQNWHLAILSRRFKNSELFMNEA